MSDTSNREHTGRFISHRVDRPLGVEAVMPVVTDDGAWYDAFYRYEQRGEEWWCVLDRLVEIMPATTPQAKRMDDQVRLHVVHEDGSFDFEGEAALRRQEWAKINRGVHA